MGKGLIFAVAILAGCTTMKAPVEDPRSIWCAHNEPRRDATADTPRAVIDDINAHNRKGTLWCQWRP